MATWRLANTSVPDAEAALWECFTASDGRVGSVSYIREVKIIGISSTIIESTMTISPTETHEFKGDEIRHCTRDSSNRFIVISTSCIVPNNHVDNMFSGVTLLEEESWFRISTIDPATVVLQARVDLKLHAGGASKSSVWF